MEKKKKASIIIFVVIVIISFIPLMIAGFQTAQKDDYSVMLTDNDSASKTEIFTATGFSIWYSGSHTFTNIVNDVDFTIYIDNMDDSNIFSLRVLKVSIWVDRTTKPYSGKLDVQLTPGVSYKVRVVRAGDYGLEGKIYQMNTQLADECMNLDDDLLAFGLYFGLALPFMIIGGGISYVAYLKKEGKIRFSILISY